MKNRLFLLGMAMMLLFAACNDPKNESPTCKISSPENNTEFNSDEDINVIVSAVDSDGVVESVSLYIDNEVFESKTEPPYHFVISAGTLTIGEHALKAMAIDDGSDKGEDVITITIKESTAPTCKITSPSENAEFNLDDEINVSVTANDINGYIVQVQLYIDDEGYDSKTDFPYNFAIPAGTLSAGTHTIKAVAINNIGDRKENAISIIVKNISAECADFETFNSPSLELPKGWQAEGGTIDPTSGYDDVYSLLFTSSNAWATTSKTATQATNTIEFYFRGGDIDFYIDDVKKETCEASSNWEKYSFYIPEGYHTFKWVLVGGTGRIDHVSFKQSLIVGMPYQGGIVAYVDETGEHGFIVAAEDQSDGIQWDEGESIEIGVSEPGIGGGKINTIAIVEAQGEGNYAAKLCYDLILNGYDDWFLPSRGEWRAIHKNKDIIGGFDIEDAIYWTSCETFFGYDPITFAIHLDEENDSPIFIYFHSRKSIFRVRAIRYF